MEKLKDILLRIHEIMFISTKIAISLYQSCFNVIIHLLITIKLDINFFSYTKTLYKTV